VITTAHSLSRRSGISANGDRSGVAAKADRSPAGANADEKPEKADPYAMGIGVTKIRRTDYAPVRALLDARP
jgi:hypothetical protein